MADEQELKERSEATELYFDEEPKHFVELAKSSLHESEEANKSLRQGWTLQWQAYENEMNMPDKEAWQADIVMNKPFTTVQQAKSVIRKALISGSYSFYDFIKKRQYANVAEVDDFIRIAKAVFDEFQGEHQGDFPSAFIDAVEMAFAVGQSMEMIPIFANGKFRWELTPPWQIYRDPYAVPRDPQSGNYWIREAWIDKWELLNLEKRGIFIDVETAMKSQGTDRNRSEDRDKNKKPRDIYETSKYFPSYRTLDYYGRIVSPTGESLLDRGQIGRAHV